MKKMASEDTYLGLSFRRVLSVDTVMPLQWRQLGFSTAKKGMKAFNMGWFGAKKNYRDRFLFKHAKRKITSLYSNASLRKLQEAIVEAHLVSKHGSTVKILSSSITFPTLAELVMLSLYGKFPSYFTGSGSFQDSSNPDEVITYTLDKSCYGPAKCRANNPGVGMNRRVGGQNLTKFSYSLTGTAVDANGYPILDGNIVLDSSGNPVLNPDGSPKYDGDGSRKKYDIEYTGESNPYVTNNKAAETIIIWYTVGSSSQIYIYATKVSSAPGSWVITKSVEVVPSIPIQINSRRDPAGSDELKYKEWFMERLGLQLRGKNGEKGIYDTLDLVDEENDGGASTNKQVDNAYIGLAVEPRDPYVLPKTGWVKSEVAQGYAARVLMYAKPDVPPPAEAKYWNIPAGPSSLKGSAAWWLKKNKLRRKKFARMFYELVVDTYGSGTVSLSMTHLQNTLTIKFTKSLNTGYFTDFNGERAYVNYIDFGTVPPSPSGGGGGYGGIFGGGSSSHNIRLRKQITTNRYEETIITELTQRISLSGESYTLFMDGSWRSSADDDNSGGAGELYPQIWVPFKMYERMDFMTNIVVKEYGLKFMFFSKVVIETSWVWMIIAIIITVVVCIVSDGALCAPMITWLAETLSVTLVVAGIIYAAIMIAINIAITEIAKMIDDPWLRAVFMIAATAVMAMMGDVNGALTNPNTYLMLAASVTTILYNTYVQIEMEKLAEEEKLRNENEAIEDKQEFAGDTAGFGGMPLDLSSHYSHTDANSPDALFSQMETIFNYDQFYDVTGVLDKRSQVVPA